MNNMISMHSNYVGFHANIISSNSVVAKSKPQELLKEPQQEEELLTMGGKNIFGDGLKRTMPMREVENGVRAPKNRFINLKL